MRRRARPGRAERGALARAPATRCAHVVAELEGVEGVGARGGAAGQICLFELLVQLLVEEQLM